MDHMIRFRCGVRFPREFLAAATDRLRVLCADDSREWRPAGLIRAGDLIEARGLVVAVEPLAGHEEVR